VAERAKKKKKKDHDPPHARPWPHTQNSVCIGGYDLVAAICVVPRFPTLSVTILIGDCLHLASLHDMHALEARLERGSHRQQVRGRDRRLLACRDDLAEHRTRKTRMPQKQMCDRSVAVRAACPPLIRRLTSIGGYHERG